MIVDNFNFDACDFDTSEPTASITDNGNCAYQVISTTQCGCDELTLGFLDIFIDGTDTGAGVSGFNCNADDCGQGFVIGVAARLLGLTNGKHTITLRTSGGTIIYTQVVSVSGC